MENTRDTIKQQLRTLQAMEHKLHCYAHHHKKMGDEQRGQGRVLALLKMKPEISQKELHYLLDMSKQALGEILGKLEKNGYIEREVNPEDTRAKVIRLTDKGAEVSEPHQKSLHDEILDCLSDEESERFSDYLSRILKRYEELLPEGHACRHTPHESFEGGHPHPHEKHCRHHHARVMFF